MRLWHYSMIPYLPKSQLLSQWRECVYIAKSIHDNGTPNHILVNRITDYPIEEFNTYCNHVLGALLERGHNIHAESIEKLEEYTDFRVDSEDRAKSKHDGIFFGWHDERYYKVCMYNLYEKWRYAKGKSKLKRDEWNLLREGYRVNMDREFKVYG